MEKVSYSLSKKAFIISFGKVINRLSALFAIIYLSYSLSKDVYGTYRQVWLLFNMLVPMLSLGIPVSINYFLPLLDENQRKTFSIQTYFLLCFLGIIFSLLLFFGSNVFAILFNNPEIAILIKYFSIIPFLCLPTLFYQNLFVCLDNPILATKVSLFSSATYILAIILPIYLGYTVSEMIGFLTIHYLIQFIIFSFLMYRTFINIDFDYSFSLLKRQVYYAIPVGLTSVIGLVSINVDKIFISSFFSPEIFAEYANGAMELPFIGILTGSIMAVLMPEFVKLYNDKNINNLIKIWHSSIIKVAFIFFPMMCVLFIYSEEFMTLFFSSKYKSSAEIFKIYLLGLPCRITIFGIILLSLNLSTYVFKYSIYTFILNLIFNYILINQFGVVGPAISTIIVTYFIATLQLNRISKEFNCKFSAVFPWKKLIQLMFISILVLLPLYAIDLLIIKKIFIMNHILKELIIIVAGSIIYSLIFLAICFWTKFLSKEDIYSFLKRLA
ncbi:MAG: hypothetical protein CL714_05765 [Chloroflexi bacterium]|nr:hypothetical protein [Chloroflexota bacterium]|tara:strand:+ start:65 stop:1558 length:1494 start_codon:yes stop_codon:yes gene_type:complete